MSPIEVPAKIQLVEKRETRTSRGMLSKGWYRVDDQLVMVKGNSITEAGTAGYEPYSEVMASLIAQVLGLLHVEYALMPAKLFPDIQTYSCDVVSVCPLFVKPGDQLYHFADLADAHFLANGQTPSPEALFQYAVELYGKKWLYQMLAFDAFIGNEDRHENNIDIIVRHYFEPLGLKLCEVTPQVLDEFQEKILLEGYTTNTVIHYHAIFGKAFKDAVRKDYLETNPMLKVDRPKKNSFRPNFYSKDEVQQLLEVSQDDPLHLCILITAYYGLRRSEVLGLKWSSIDFERKSITINHKVTEQLVNGKYVPVVSDVMKNKTSCRTLPLIPAVEEELLKQKEKQQLYRKLFKKSYSTEYLDFVCTDQEGKLIRPNFVTEHFDWLLTKYGLKHIRFHDLRHSCASLMVMNGVSMKQVQEWLGHSTFSTTADIYAHLDYKSKQGSAGVIANLLGESKLPK